MSDGLRATWMRGGTSKGGYFLAKDLPEDVSERDRLLLRVMGSPDSRQIDGMGGADPLTSKIAVVRKSERPGIDVDYLFLQVFVDQPIVSDRQNCGNLLAAVGSFAIERSLVKAEDPVTTVSIFMENTGARACAVVQTPGGRVTYRGDVRIDGVPEPSAPVTIEFEDVQGSSCGALLPTGNAVDEVRGTKVTMIDNGMPSVILSAVDVGISGSEAPDELDADASLKEKLEAIRLRCGPLMNLGNVAELPVPKLAMVSPAIRGGTISTRTFIPHRCHKAIGVFGGLTVAAAALLAEGPAAAAASAGTGQVRDVLVEHPNGTLRIVARLDDQSRFVSAAVVSTARKLFDGHVFAD